MKKAAKLVRKWSGYLVRMRPRFNTSKCKTAAKMAVARIKLLRNKREAVVRQMRRDIALLLHSGQAPTARIRVEHVIREQNALSANEIIELFCDLVVARLPIIASKTRRDCPPDLKEAISSLIFAAPRCSDIPELLSLRNLFLSKYGSDFVSAASDLRPNCGVNRLLIDKLSVQTPSGELKLKLLKEIAKEHNVEWDPSESEKELLKPPHEELLEGPHTFVSAASFPVNLTSFKTVERNNPTHASKNERGTGNLQFHDTASAAEAAAESAKHAIAAAQAAAQLANMNFGPVSQTCIPNHNPNGSRNMNQGLGMLSGNCKGGDSMPNMSSGISGHQSCREEAPPRHLDGEPFNGRRYGYSDVLLPSQSVRENVARTHGYNATSQHMDIKFDESDCDEESDIGDHPPPSVHPPPPRRPPPAVPSPRDSLDAGVRIHPKLPDYDDLSARFEALKYRKP